MVCGLAPGRRFEGTTRSGCVSSHAPPRAHLGVVLLLFWWPLPALAQLSTSPRTILDAQAEVAKVLYAASATQAAAQRAANVTVRALGREIEARDKRLRSLRSEIEPRDAKLRAQRSEIETADVNLRAQRTEIERLQTQERTLVDGMAVAQEQYVAALAARDRTYAEEIALFRGAVQDIATTPEGVAALARFNAGDEVGALAALDRLTAARKAARQRRNDIEEAADRRRNATLALDAGAKEKITIADLIVRFEEVVRLYADGGVTLMSPAGKTTRDVSPTTATAYAFSADGRTIYGIRPAAAHRVELFSISVDGGPEKTIGTLAREYLPAVSYSPSLRLSLTPDGKSITYGMIRRTDNLWLMDGLKTVAVR